MLLSARHPGATEEAMEQPAAPLDRQTPDQPHQVDTDSDRYTVAAMLDLLAEENLPMLMRRQVA
jgi:hypothetical protein